MVICGHEEAACHFYRMLEFTELLKQIMQNTLRDACCASVLVRSAEHGLWADQVKSNGFLHLHCGWRDLNCQLFC